MKKVISLAVAGALSLALINPAFAASGHGGWHRGGQSHGWHGGGGHVGWWLPGALIGGLVVGSVIAAITPRVYYGYPEPVYVTPPPAVYPQSQVYLTPVPRESCYPSGCYRLYGDGVTVAYQWVWVPNPVAPAPPAPPAPPLGPPQQ
jgi:hypothetical protein